MLSAALVLLLGSPPTDARAGGEPGGPVSHGGHPDLSEHYSHLAHQDPSHLEHLRAIKAHKAAAGDTIGRLARGSGRESGEHVRRGRFTGSACASQRALKHAAGACKCALVQAAAQELVLALFPRRAAHRPREQRL